MLERSTEERTAGGRAGGQKADGVVVVVVLAVVVANPLVEGGPVGNLEDDVAQGLRLRPWLEIIAATPGIPSQTYGVPVVNSDPQVGSRGLSRGVSRKANEPVRTGSVLARAATAEGATGLLQRLNGLFS
ncbi:hypothetical protein B0J14DRAFT_646002 [Halenospora varia]|nr:hypothetical protein B0J14DRAFT_646002 [Halenospora varia]